MSLDDGSGSRSLLYRIWKSAMNKKNTNPDDASSGETESIDKIFAVYDENSEDPEAEGLKKTAENSDGEVLSEAVESQDEVVLSEAAKSQDEVVLSEAVESQDEVVLSEAAGNQGEVILSRAAGNQSEKGSGGKAAVSKGADKKMVLAAEGHPRSDVMKIKINYLEAIRSGVDLNDIPLNMESYFSDFTHDGEEPNRLEKIFIREIQQTAKTLLEKGEPPQTAEAEESGEAEKSVGESEKTAGTGESKKPVGESEKPVGESEKPVGAEESVNGEPEKLAVSSHVCIKVPLDNMSAWIFVFPPLNGGMDVTKEQIVEALKVSGVKFGMNQDLIKEFASQKVYMKLAVIAEGRSAIDGIDGFMVDYFPRVERNKFTEQEDDDDRKVDYKDLNWIHQIAKDDVICDVTFPVDGVDGMMVTGQVIAAIKPKAFVLPQGENVVLNEEKTILFSKIEGSLFYEKGKFHVKDVLHIMSDVDLSVGNINTIGNVVIGGDVLSGFTVKTTGNIEIRGMVGNSTIVAGGSIKIGMGVRGNGEARLEAGAAINCGYMENCTAEAIGNIESGSIINCKVQSDDSVISKNIVGGSVTALNKITATTIGNHQRRQAVFNLGITQQLLKERTFLNDQVEQLEQSLAQAKKNLRFLTNKKGKVNKDDVRFAQLTLEAADQKERLGKYRLRLEEINAEIENFSDCELTANIIFPPATVMIRGDALVIDREESMCRIRAVDGAITMF